MIISNEEQKLIEAAKRARERAVAPYSKFKVGAAIETSDGQIFTGCNIENSSYSLTMCAERTALFKAVSEGARGFVRIAVVADTEQLTTPCGACRQVLWEFCSEATVILANLRGAATKMTMREILPLAFDANLLPET